MFCLQFPFRSSTKYKNYSTNDYNDDDDDVAKSYTE